MTVLPVNTHVVAEQPVHANVFEAAFAVRVSQLPLPVAAQALVRAARADAALEHRVEQTIRLSQVSGDHPHGIVGSGVGQINGSGQTEKTGGSY